MMHRPAYAPEFFVDRPILWTVPYTMPGELFVTPNQSPLQFPEGQFRHDIDKPFEIWRMIVRLTGFTGTPQTSAVIPDTQPLTLDKRIRLALKDFSKNEVITKSPQLVGTMQKQNEQTWEWDPRPYTIGRNEGFQVIASSDAFPSICVPNASQEGDCDIEPIDITFVRIEVTFQGWLLVVEPPSNTRG